MPIDAQTIARIAGARAVELSHPLTNGMPNHESHPPFIYSPFLRFGDFELADGYWGTNELIVMSGHSGTHIDSVAHVARDGKLFGGHDAATEYWGGGGLKHHAIDTVAPIVRRGVLLDVATYVGVGALEPARAIDGDELAAVAQAAGVEVRAGDCVIVRTGHGRHWGDRERYLGEGEGAPGISVDGATWLAERDVFLVGSDNSVVEVSQPDGETLPVHMLLLAQHGVHLLENMALEELRDAGAAEFLFVCLPLLLKGASGSPVRPVALV